MSSARTTAVIVTYNSRAVVGAGLDEARRAHDAGMLECILVDNASADGTVAFVRSHHPWVRVLETGGNLGFGRGCNVGIAHTVTPYLLLVNPDAAVPPASIRILEEFMDAHPRAALCGPATRLEHGLRLQHAGGLLTPWLVILQAAGFGLGLAGRRLIDPGCEPFRTDWIGGGIMFWRTSVLRALGGFDPRFFLYFDETDLCKRALDAGHEIWANGRATASHLCGTSAKETGQELYSGSIAEHYFRSRFYYLCKHHGLLPAAACELVELPLLGARSAAKRMLGRPAGLLGNRLRGPILKWPQRPGPPTAAAAPGAPGESLTEAP